MIRTEYWERAKELIESCNEEELKVLAQPINLAEASVQRNILFNQHEIELEIIEEFEL
jgi:hypothetical protein